MVLVWEGSQSREGLPCGRLLLSGVCNVRSSPQQHPGYNCVSRSKSREREQDKKENDGATARGKDKKEEKERKDRKRVSGETQ